MQTETTNDSKNKAFAELAGKYLTFRLGDENFGIEILKVQEIIGMQKITKIPKAPAAVKGVINLRGKVIPVVDLRLKFGLEEAEVSRKTCIIVVLMNFEESEMIMGIVVDEVSEVIEIDSSQIEPSPTFGNQCKADFILGMAKVDEEVEMLLDLDKILNAHEMANIVESV